MHHLRQPVKVKDEVPMKRKDSETDRTKLRHREKPTRQKQRQ
jgi:hypothetical protein